MRISIRQNGSVADYSVFLTVIIDIGSSVESEGGENHPKFTIGNVCKFMEAYGEDKKNDVLLVGASELVSERVRMRVGYEVQRQFYDNAEKNLTGPPVTPVKEEYGMGHVFRNVVS